MFPPVLLARQFLYPRFQYQGNCLLQVIVRILLLSTWHIHPISSFALMLNGVSKVIIFPDLDKVLFFFATKVHLAGSYSLPAKETLSPAAFVTYTRTSQSPIRIISGKIIPYIVTSDFASRSNIFPLLVWYEYEVELLSYHQHPMVGLFIRGAVWGAT